MTHFRSDDDDELRYLEGYKWTCIEREMDKKGLRNSTKFSTVVSSHIEVKNSQVELEDEHKHSGDPADEEEREEAHRKGTD